MGKKFTYDEDQVNQIYRYLMAKPMVEVEALVAVLRNAEHIAEDPNPPAPQPEGQTSNEESQQGQQ